MKTSFDILEKLYVILNVASINTVIDGRIYAGNKKANSELQDIEILTLPVMWKPDVQPCTVIINMYCKNLSYGIANNTKLNSIINAVINVLEAYSQSSNTSYFDFDFGSTNSFPDEKQVNMSYASLRLNCVIQTS